MTADIIYRIFKKAGRPITITSKDSTYQSYAVISPLSSGKAFTADLSFEQNGLVDARLYEVLAPITSPAICRDDVISFGNDCFVVECADIIYYSGTPCYIKATARKCEPISTTIS